MSSTDNSSLTFGARRGKWLDQVHDDPEMGGAFWSVMYAITRCLNRGTFTCTAGNVHLAELAHVTDRTVKSAIRKARERGHIETDRPSRREVAHIRPVLKDDPERGKEVPTERGNERGNERGKPFRGPLVESKGCAADSHNSQDSHKYREEADSKNGLPRGPTAPPSDSPKPSCAESFEVPCPRRGWQDRLAEAPLLTREEEAAFARLSSRLKANGGTVGLSS